MSSETPTNLERADSFTSLSSLQDSPAPAVRRSARLSGRPSLPDANPRKRTLSTSTASEAQAQPPSDLLRRSSRSNKGKQRYVSPPPQTQEPQSAEPDGIQEPDRKKPKYNTRAKTSATMPAKPKPSSSRHPVDSAQDPSLPEAKVAKKRQRPPVSSSAPHTSQLVMEVDEPIFDGGLLDQDDGILVDDGVLVDDDVDSEGDGAGPSGEAHFNAEQLQEDEGHSNSEPSDEEFEGMAVDQAHEADNDEDDAGDHGLHDGGFSSFSNVFAGLSDFMSGFSGRLKTILSQLRARESGDPMQKLEALQELAEILSISTEDTLAGYFQIDAFVKELVQVLKGQDMAFVGEESGVEMMLLACRCLANLMEALPGSGHNIVAAGAVDILCAKLLEIQYIDLAEQTLSTLEKISEEVPGSIVRAGGLAALLSYLDFFSTNVQRTAVTAAANCCRSISPDLFGMVRDVVPILRNVLSYSDQRVVEQACLAVARIIESYRHYPDKLEPLLTADLLEALVNNLLPTASPIANSTYTQLIRMLALAARTSPQIATSLLELNVGNVLYQILTGVSAPAAGEEIAHIKKTSASDDMIVLQNLVHRPKDQVQEALVFIVELMPALPRDGIFHSKPNATRKKTKAKVVKEEETPIDAEGSQAQPAAGGSQNEDAEVKQEPRSDPDALPPTPAPKRSSNDIRIDTFNDTSEVRQKAIRRFFALMLPTLVDVYSASVGVTIRTKSMLGMTKIVFLCPKEHLAEILKALPLANFLGSILASKDHSSLIVSGLQLVELLLVKVPDVSQYLFRREGVMHEVEHLASAPLFAPSQPKDTAAALAKNSAVEAAIDAQSAGPNPSTVSNATAPPGSSDASASTSAQTAEKQVKDLITLRARFMRDRYGLASSAGWAQQAAKDLKTYKDLASILEYFAGVPLDEVKQSNSINCLKQIAALFTKPTQSISSFEMLESGLVGALLKFLLASRGSSREPCRGLHCLIHSLIPDDALAKQSLFARVFTSSPPGGGVIPLAALVKRLQESLSRLEEFEVITALQGSGDDRQNSASMLGRQLKLRLSSEDADVPRSCSNIVVSIHAIATFQAFNDYLRPRIQAAADRIPSSSLSAVFRAATASEQSPTASRSGTGQGAPSTSANAPSASEMPQNAAQQIVRRRSSRIAKASASTSGNPAAERSSEDQELDLDGVLDADEARDDQTTNLERVGDDAHLEGHTPGGTRVATPIHRSTEAAATPSPFAAPRTSYAAALKTAPSDWHLEFFMDDTEVQLDTTIYGAVHQYEVRHNGLTSRNMWNNIYSVKFRKVAGIGRSITPRTSPEPVGQDSNPLNALPDFIPKHSPQARILQLLRALHTLNVDMPELLNTRAVARLNESAFINNKLTAKLNRQLEEPMIVASSCLPDWALDFPQSFPFLFPFESRFSFLQSTSFGYARLMQKWLGQARQDSRRDDNFGFLGRLQRQKVRLARDRLLESALKVFELYGQSRAVLEYGFPARERLGLLMDRIEFFSEVGTGLGPTLEFYAMVSKEFSRKDLKMWRTSDSTNPSPYVDHPCGLFPSPMQDDLTISEGGRKVSAMFRVLGQFVAKGLMDSRIIDLPFNRTFMKLVLDHELPMTTATVKTVDPTLGNSLDHLQDYVTAKAAILGDISNSDIDKSSRMKGIKIKDASVDDLSLDFTLPGYPDIELKPGGRDIGVTIDNVEEYVQLVIEYTLKKGTERQVRAFREGFSEVFPVKDLACFTADELVLVFGNSSEDWTIPTLHDSIRADHGFSMDSRVVNDLLAILSGFNKSEQRLFLSFSTGSPRLPVGGFKSLHPPLTVVRKPPESGRTPDDYLPSVMTCQNYIKMPEYSSSAVLASRLATAVTEGQGSFHLS